MEWYRKAAEQGQASSQNNLGAMYWNGHRVDQSNSNAGDWFRKAAEQGNSTTPLHLLGVEQQWNGIAKQQNKAILMRYLILK